MGRNIIISLFLRGAGAAAWLGYCWVLTRILTDDALGQVLYSLALAGFLAAITSAGWAQILLREGSRYMDQNQPELLAHVVLKSLQGAGFRVIFIMVGVTIAYCAGILPNPISTPKLAMLTVLVSAVLAVVLLLSSAQRASGNLIKSTTGSGLFRAGIPLGLSVLLTLIEPVTSVSALLIHLAALVVIAGWLFIGLPKKQLHTKMNNVDQTALRDLGLAQMGYVLISHLDVLILGWVAGPIEAGIYLIIRRITGLLNLVFDALRNAFSPNLAVAFQQEQHPNKEAAYVNRAFLIAGGVTTVCLMLSGHYILESFRVSNAFGIYFWLLLANAAPAFFGATGFLMMMANMERLRLIFIATLLPFGIAILFWAGSFGVYELAMAYALLQFALGACGAIALRLRHNIYPSLLMVFPSIISPH